MGSWGCPDFFSWASTGVLAGKMKVRAEVRVLNRPCFFRGKAGDVCPSYHQWFEGRLDRAKNSLELFSSAAKIHNLIGKPR